MAIMKQILPTGLYGSICIIAKHLFDNCCANIFKYTLHTSIFFQIFLHSKP